jgi:hypothetical protein
MYFGAYSDGRRYGGRGYGNNPFEDFFRSIFR